MASDEIAMARQAPDRLEHVAASEGEELAKLGRGEVCADPAVRAELRRTQSLRTLAARRRRAIGATAR